MISMKNLLAGAATLMAAGVVSAATSGSIILSGEVLPTQSISLTEFGVNNTTLDIANGASNYKVATYSVVSNTPTGFKIQIKSTNGGKLTHASASSFADYTVKVGSNPHATPTTTYADVASTVGSSTAATIENGDISVNLSPITNPVAGTYSDELFYRILAL